MKLKAIPLSELADITAGGGAPQNENDFSNSGIPFIRAGSLIKLLNGCCENNLEKIEPSVAVRHRLRLFPSGTVLFAKSGMSATKGHIYALRKPAYVVSHLAALIPREASDSSFIVRALEYYPPTSLIRDAAYPSIRLSDIEAMKVFAPANRNHRERIAAILNQADALRKLRQRSIDRLDDLSQAIFYDMFGDLTTNPMGWDVVKLGEVCGVGSSKRVFVDEFVAEGVPFYRGTEVGELAESKSIQPHLFISPEHYKDLIDHSGKPEIGDLLLPSICHDGRIWRVDSEKPFYFKDGRVLWIKKNESVLNSEYLRHHLRNVFLRNYTSIASGTTFAELKIVNLKGLSILRPPLKLQIEFSKRISEVEDCRIALVKSQMATNSLFSSLQTSLFH